MWAYDEGPGYVLYLWAVPGLCAEPNTSTAHTQRQAVHTKRSTRARYTRHTHTILARREYTRTPGPGRPRGASRRRHDGTPLALLAWPSSRPAHTQVTLPAPHARDAVSEKAQCVGNGAVQRSPMHVTTSGSSRGKPAVQTIVPLVRVGCSPVRPEAIERQRAKPCVSGVRRHGVPAAHYCPKSMASSSELSTPFGKWRSPRFFA